MTKTTLSLGQPRKRGLPTARDLVVQTLKEMPDAPASEQFRRFEYLLDLNPQCQPQVNQHYFTSIERDLRRTRSKADNDAMRAESAIVVRAEADKVIREIVLLALTMPNGKEMAQCTGAEMAGFGVAYQRIAKAVGPKRLVGAVLDEEGVRRLITKHRKP